MEKLAKKIINWAKERDLLHYQNAETQYKKFLEEVGETARACLKGDQDGIKDGFGDVAITVIILAAQLGDKISYSIPPGSVDETESFHWFVSEVSPIEVHKNTLDLINDVSMFYGYSLEECLKVAWNEIKDRTGKTENKTFVKD